MDSLSSGSVRIVDPLVTLEKQDGSSANPHFRSSIFLSKVREMEERTIDNPQSVTVSTFLPLYLSTTIPNSKTVEKRFEFPTTFSLSLSHSRTFGSNKMFYSLSLLLLTLSLSLCFLWDEPFSRREYKGEGKENNGQESFHRQRNSF